MKRKTVFGIIICLCFAQTALADCWKPISPDNITKDEEWRYDDENRYLSIVGDFNGDGKKDKAQLGISQNGKNLFLVVLLNTGKDEFKQYILVNGMESKSKDSMGIKLLKAGTYETACSKGYFDCSPESNLPITIEFDAIEFFKYESASSMFFWDKDSENFKRIWLSD